MDSNSDLETFKALVDDAFRDAPLNLRQNKAAVILSEAHKHLLRSGRGLVGRGAPYVSMGAASITFSRYTAGSPRSLDRLGIGGSCRSASLGKNVPMGLLGLCGTV
jgi:hypothetical protein